MQTPPDLMSLLMAQLMLMLQLGIGVAVLTVAFTRWPQVRERYRPGLLLGAIVFVLGLPSLVATSLYFDVGALLPLGQEPQVARFLGPVLKAVMALVGLGTAVLGLFFLPLKLGVGELALTDGRRAYPWLLDGRRDTRGWGLAAVVGAAAGALSMLLFWSLGVDEGPALEVMRKLFPRLSPDDPTTLLVVTLPAVVVAAVSEEVVFRGLVQPWLTRWLGGGTRAVALAVVVTSAAWAFAHWGNTDAPWLKVGQIFLFGLALGALARRHSVEASMVAHAALNVVAVLATLVLKG